MKVLQMAVCLLYAFCSVAQPGNQQIITRLTHAGVVKVEVVKTVKEWHNSKYVYVAYTNVIKAVPPEKVCGLKGVTLVIATMAYYDVGASQPYQVLGSESNGEYRGINLPFPANNELEQWGLAAAKENPEKFFLQGNSILGIDVVKVEKPNCVWLHPLKLKFEANAIYVEKLTGETIQKLTGRCEIELHRNGLNDTWYLGKAAMQTNESRYIGEPIHISDAPEWKNKPTLTERKANAAARIANAGVTSVTFTSGKELVTDVLAKFHEYDKQKMQEYLSVLLSSDLKNTGGISLNGNGEALMKNTIDAAYNGWGKFKDQYCAIPEKTEIWANEIKFYNKTGQQYSKIDFKKDAAGYTIENIVINKDNTEVGNAQLKMISCNTTNVPIVSMGFIKGQKVLVEENGKWYPATVLEAKTNEWYIHYEGYSSKYDLWVNSSRIKAQ